MIAAESISIDSPMTLALAATVAGAAIVLALWRKVGLPRGTQILFAIGLSLLVLSAGGLRWRREVPGTIAVMLDNSPSTRGAAYRERTWLENRLKLLLGKNVYQIKEFSDAGAEETAYTPPTADAVVLLSDGRFELPAINPPTYPVIDPNLEDPADARVKNLELRGDKLVASLWNGGKPRALTLAGISDEPSAKIGSGAMTLPRTVKPESAVASAEFAPGDLWPENDAMSINVLPPMASQRWWVGSSDPGAGWTKMSPSMLPAEAAAYLAPAVIVLENIPAGDLSAVAQQRLVQYVRDLGGSLVITGGDRAFAGGQYVGSTLEGLSPLASVPPMPTSHWILLADSSGSMASPVGPSTRWQQASGALAGMLAALPTEDLTSVGNFAEQVEWWSQRKSVKQTQAMPLPPAQIAPRGPTNLESALRRVIDESDGTMPVQLLVLTDAETKIEKASELIERMKAKKIRLHLLAIGKGSALETLRTMIDATGGLLVEQADPAKWSAGARELLRGAMPDQLMHTAVDVTIANRPKRTVSLWNRTWAKDGSALLAETKSGSETLPLAARWQVGGGRVIAAGFQADAKEAAALAEMIAQGPRDPRFAVSWEMGASLRVAANAADRGAYLNGLKLELDVADEHQPIQQVAPGRYEATVSSPRQSGFATVRLEGTVVDRIALAGRYAPEFDEIGTSHSALRSIAQRSGGEVIEPNRTKPIDFRWPSREQNLSAILAIIGVGLVAIGLVWWRVV